MENCGIYVEYGNAAAEVLYKREEGGIVFDGLRDVYPRDALPLVRKGAMVGVQVKGNAYPSSAGVSPGSVNLFPPRAFWVAHRARHGNFWGYSRYQGAWWPWLEKRGRHGATDVRRMWYIKNAFRGMRIRHPPGMLEKPDGSLMSCQDYARQIVERAETGGVLALPNAKDPNSGEYLWVIEDAAINGDLSGVREYAKDLDGEILTGFEIPPEVAAAAEVGAGWSGRSVPFMVFLTGEDEIVAELVAAIVQWILTPLVEVNFGPGQPFAVEPVSLVELLTQQGQGQGHADGAKASEPPAPAQRPATAQRLRMSLEQDRDSAARILDGILDRGTQAGLVAADEIRRRIRGLVKKKCPSPRR